MTETPGRMAPTTDRGLSPVCLGIWSAQARHTLLDGTALLLVMLAAGVLRFVMLDARELFRDEAGSWLLASAAWHEIVPRSAAEPYAPVYQFLLKAWMSLFGDSHAALRALSGAAGLMLVGVTWAWARQALGSSVPAVIAAGLVALSPLALANSRDVRMYGLEALLILLAWWLLWRLLADRRPLPQRWAAILLAAAAVAAELWTLPTGVAAFALQLAVVGILQLRAPHLGVRAGGLALAAGLVAFLPGIPRMLDAASVQQPYWTPTPNLGDLPETFGVAFGGAIPSAAWVALPALLLLAGFGLWTLLKRGRESLAMALCVAGGASLIILWWALSQWRSAYDTRYLGAAIPPLAIAIGVGWERLSAAANAVGARLGRAMSVLGIGMLVLVVSGSATFTAAWVRGDSGLAPAEAAARALQQHLHRGDVVVAADARSYLPLAYATGRSAGPIDLVAPVRYWRSGGEPAFLGGDLVPPNATILPGDLLVPGALPGLAAGGSIWLVAITAPDAEIDAFTPLRDGSLIEVERVAVAGNEASGWLVRLRPRP